MKKNYAIYLLDRDRNLVLKGVIKTTLKRIVLIQCLVAGRAIEREFYLLLNGQEVAFYLETKASWAKTQATRIMQQEAKVVNGNDYPVTKRFKKSKPKNSGTAKVISLTQWKKLHRSKSTKRNVA